MRSVMRNARLLGGPVALALALGAAPAGAQPEAAVYATGSIDGHAGGIGLVGVTARGGGLGLQPVAALQAYYLQYTIPDSDAPGDEGEDVSLLGVQPQVGLAWYGYGGAIEGRVGYSIVSFSGEDDAGGEDVVLEGEAGGEGLTTTLQAQTWSTRPEFFGMASYNWGAEYLYTQAQAVLPLGRFGVGAEAVWQQHMGDDADGDQFEYRSTSFGPLVRFGLGPESALTLAGGYKDDNVRDPTWYARLTVVRWGIGF